ncbi:MAG: RluA family pseudouridine synthase [Betaproteobacteria bacterium]|nr:MAG: RluA family pseudouridine synthase [Betaproteobacteria bacterium]
MNGLSKGSVNWVEVDESAEGQRIDNFLAKSLKGVPRSHIYRILRSGEVRVNSGRVSATYRLKPGDRVRIPPVRIAAPTSRRGGKLRQLGETPLYEDEWLLAIDKPAGVAVHGGSGISLGAIEKLREERPNQPFLELIHRLDRETSGVLLLAKRRRALTDVHAQLRHGQVDKRYQVLVLGNWTKPRQSVRLPLRKYVLGGGERRVAVDAQGAAAMTVFKLLGHYDGYSLLEAELKTGRTHQIRVHLSHLGFPIAGDDKYGNFEINKTLEKRGLKRMFLHAVSVTLKHPATGERLRIEAPLPVELDRFLASIDVAGT